MPMMQTLSERMYLHDRRTVRTPVQQERRSPWPLRWRLIGIAAAVCAIVAIIGA